MTKDTDDGYFFGSKKITAGIEVGRLSFFVIKDINNKTY